MKKTAILLTMFAWGLQGCANAKLPYPRAVLSDGTDQLKIQSAAHWQVLAQNELQQLGGFLQTRPRIYVSEHAAKASPFATAFHQMLISRLLNEGATVMIDAAEADFKMDYSTQVVIHQRKERQRFRPGVATAFVIGANVIRDSAHWHRPALMQVPLAIGVDLWSSYWPDSKADITEVIISTRLYDDNTIIMAGSRVYYFNTDDMHNFRESRSFPIVGAAREQ